MAVVNHDYCKSTTTLSHEIAHNLGLQHSGRILTGNQFDQYRDQTGLLGFSDGRDDAKVCFNAPKSYQTGWYASRDVTLDRFSFMFTHSIDNPWTADLVGVADYDQVSGAEVVTIKLDDGNATAPQYYIGFNRKTGMNADTKGPKDKVIVSTQDTKGQSWLVAALDVSQVYDIPDYFGSGKDARIQYLGYTNAEPRRAKIAIYPMDAAICQGDISLVDQVGSGNYESLPIKIVSQDTTSITIDVYNTWDGDALSNMFTRYDDTSFETTCPEMRDVAKTDAPSRYTIACTSNGAVAHVDIFVSKPSFSTELGDTADVPKCCHPQADFLAPAVQYIFLLQCVSQCPTEGMARRRLRGSSHYKEPAEF